MQKLHTFFASRMIVWLAVSLLLMLAVGLLAPQQLPVSLYKLSLVTSAAWVGYWIDRSLFPYARPDAFLLIPWSPGIGAVGEPQVEPSIQVALSAAMIRRALIISAAMIAVGLGA